MGDPKKDEVWALTDEVQELLASNRHESPRRSAAGCRSLDCSSKGRSPRCSGTCQRASGVRCTLPAIPFHRRAIWASLSCTVLGAAWGAF